MDFLKRLFNSGGEDTPDITSSLFLDEKLWTLCEYEQREGKKLIPANIDPEKYYNKLVKRFNYYKVLIQKGELTLPYLEKQVVNKYSLTPSKVGQFDNINDLLENVEVEYQKSLIKDVREVTSIGHALFSTTDSDASDGEIPLYAISPDADELTKIINQANIKTELKRRPTQE
jgi:hypothetical protein